jgi:hypothetical protein
MFKKKKSLEAENTGTCFEVINRVYLIFFSFFEQTTSHEVIGHTRLEDCRVF